MTDTQSIPQDYVMEVCKLGQGTECCSYLAIGAETVCGKTIPSLKKSIDERRASGTMRAMGDNCEGWELTAEQPEG